MARLSRALTSPAPGASWAAPEGKDGKLTNKAMTGDDLRDSVNAKLFL
jgi:hypothetical protein